jgi:hypothetical protein
MIQASFADLAGDPQQGPFVVGVGADAPGLVKPALAQWYYDPSQVDAPWQAMACWNFGGSLSYPSGSQMSAGGFAMATDWNQGGNTLLPEVRIPLQATLWLGITLTTNADGSQSGNGAFAAQTSTAAQGTTIGFGLQEPMRTWVDVPILVQDGNGNPNSTGLNITPAHAPHGWTYTGTPDGSTFSTDPNLGTGTLNLPQGETVLLQTAPPPGYPNGCYPAWWSGSFLYLIPTPTPADPVLLAAPTEIPGQCNQ